MLNLYMLNDGNESKPIVATSMMAAIAAWCEWQKVQDDPEQVTLVSELSDALWPREVLEKLDGYV